MWRKFKEMIGQLTRSDEIDNSKNDSPPTLLSSLQDNKEILTTALQDNEDLVVRDIELEDETSSQLSASLVYITSLIDKTVVNENILKALLANQKTYLKKLATDKEIEIISRQIIDAEEVEPIKQVEKAINKILTGHTILLVDGIPTVLSIATQGGAERSVTRPVAERTVRGPSDGFVESIEVNRSLIRRRIKSQDLKLESFTKGKYTKTNIDVAYIDGIADDQIVKEVKKRIESIEVGQITGGRHVLELIEDNPLSPFETVFETERPDVTAAGLLEGRVVLLVDEYPSVLVVPMLFMENLISPEDYYTSFYYTLLARGIRFLGFLVSTLLPAVYISILSFHQEILPGTLVSTIYAAREGVPFPIAIEMIIFGIFFEGIKEAGARTPQPLGSSVTIVGALILGDAAVNSGVLSPDSVIIGALTGIAIFLIPTVEFNNTLLLFRGLFVLGASVAGFYGLTLVVLLTICHLTGLRSFGVPYMSPLAPLQTADLKDVFFRVPYLVMNTRPQSLQTENQVQQNNKPVKRFFFKYKLPEINQK